MNFSSRPVRLLIGVISVFVIALPLYRFFLPVPILNVLKEVLPGFLLVFGLLVIVIGSINVGYVERPERRSVCKRQIIIVLIGAVSIAVAALGMKRGPAVLPSGTNASDLPTLIRVLVPLGILGIAMLFYGIVSMFVRSRTHSNIEK
jgi:hypothetical protein